MVLVTISLLGFSFFFGKFVDISYMEVGGKFETTYGVMYKKYRYWN